MKKKASIRVVVAAASAVRRAGLESFLSHAAGLHVVGTIPGLATAVQRAIELQADLLVVDIEADTRGKPNPLPMQSPTAIPLVALVDQPGLDWSALALRSGAHAILPRDADAAEIVPAIQAAYDGLFLLDGEVMADLLTRIPVRLPNPTLPGEELTPRELEVLRMLAEGMGNREMSGRMGITENTVKFHISSILDKFGAATRTEAVTMGVRSGLIVL